MPDNYGAPPKEVELRTGRVRATQSGSDGSFLLRGVTMNPLGVVRAFGTPGMRAEGCQITNTKDAVGLVLRPCGTVCGTILDGSAPAEGAVVSIGTPEFANTQTDQDGKFSMANIPEGIHALVVALDPPPERWQRKLVSVTKAGVIDISISL
jgi:hypothetical protein